MPGLFIRRQAVALARKHSVTVISVHPDPSVGQMFEADHEVFSGVEEIRVYYRPSQKYGPVSKLVNTWRSYHSHLLGFRKLPAHSAGIIHAHILTREAFFAYLLGRKLHRPFVVSEHWSRYFPENGTYRGWFRKIATRFLVKHSSALLCVSASLKKAMSAYGISHPQTYIIPNVVDTDLFLADGRENRQSVPVVLHVSCFEDRSKNISGLLRAVAELSRRGLIFRLVMAGEGPDLDRMKILAEELGLGPEMVLFTGLVENEDLARLYNSSSFLVQTSRYETFGTVVIEAMACGLPVLSTRTGVAVTAITHETGRFIDHPGVPEILLALEQMLEIYSTFDRQIIRDSVLGLYSEENMARMLEEVYKSVLAGWKRG